MTADSAKEYNTRRAQVIAEARANLEAARALPEFYIGFCAECAEEIVSPFGEIFCEKHKYMEIAPCGLSVGLEVR